MIAETPTICSASYGNSVYGLNQEMENLSKAIGLLPKAVPFSWSGNLNEPSTPTTPPPMASNNQKRRFVQVFIADPNENVPLDRAVLYTGPQKLTDATDAELYFEVAIKDLLDAHNAQRVAWLDKEASRKAGKDIALEPARIRDLKMVVVTIAEF